jgi:hypothetical protein
VKLSRNGSLGVSLALCKPHTSIYRESPEGLSFLLSGDHIHMDQSQFEESIEKLGNEHIKKEKEAYDSGLDQISSEIAEYKRKYGKTWYTKYCNDAHMLALNEQKRAMDALSHGGGV